MAAHVEQCSACKWFWQKVDGNKTGECHRYAPAPQDCMERVKVWPTVKADDGCGDYLVIPKK